MDNVLRLLVMVGGFGAIGVMCSLGIALAKRIGRASPHSTEFGERLEVTEQRLAETEDGLLVTQERVAELEERLEFAERLIQQARERNRLPGA